MMSELNCGTCTEPGKTRVSESYVDLSSTSNCQNSMANVTNGNPNSLNLVDLRVSSNQVSEHVNRVLSSINQEQRSFHQGNAYGTPSEKDRLAFLFENSPNVLDRYAYRPWPLYERNVNQNVLLNNKENCDPKVADLQPSDSDFLRTGFSKSHKKDDNTRRMVRFGEFSPLNPAFISNSKTVLGLGEYEERRKIFLEKKKREYQQYLLNAKSIKEQEKIKEKTQNKLKESHVSGFRGRASPQKTYREIFSPERGLITASDATYTRCQQEAYRKELDKQVYEKKQRQKEQEEKERQELEKQQKDMIFRHLQFSQLMEEECSRLQSPPRGQTPDATNDSGLADFTTPEKIENRQHSTSNETVEFHQYRKSSPKSPILRPGGETCAVEDLDAYRKMQQDVYKKELAKQIEEKKKLQLERKLKDLEEDKKIEKKVKEDEEKLRLEFEKDQAEKAYRAAQRVQQEERLQEHLRKTQREAEERRKTDKLRTLPSVYSKATVFPTHHTFTKNSKNVSFAPNAYVYNIRNSNLSLNESNPKPQPLVHRKSDSSIIIEAPYTLAVKESADCDNSIDCNIGGVCNVRTEPTCRSPSPPIPALRTRNLLKPAVVRTEDSVIPPTVSMSRETREKFLRDNKILSNLTEIRRKLLERQLDSQNN